MRTRSITTALVLTVVLTATTLSAATRDTAPRPSQPVERPSITVKIKRAVIGLIRALEGPTLPIPFLNS